jgi:hypothetical protein
LKPRNFSSSWKSPETYCEPQSCRIVMPRATPSAKALRFSRTPYLTGSKASKRVPGLAPCTPMQAAEKWSTAPNTLTHPSLRVKPGSCPCPTSHGRCRG